MSELDAVNQGTWDTGEAVARVRDHTPNVGCFLTGSRTILSEGNDVDVVALADIGRFPGIPWDPSPAYDGEDGWVSYRHGHINLIWCETLDAYYRWKRATDLMVELHRLGPDMSQKACRVALFEMVVDELPQPSQGELNGP